MPGPALGQRGDGGMGSREELKMGRASEKLGGKPHLHMAPPFLHLKLRSAKAPSQRHWTERNETAEGFSYPLPIPFPSLPGERDMTKVPIPAPAAPEPHQLMPKSLL